MKRSVFLGRRGGYTRSILCWMQRASPIGGFALHIRHIFRSSEKGVTLPNSILPTRRIRGAIICSSFWFAMSKESGFLVLIVW